MKNLFVAILFFGSAAFLLYALYDRILSNDSFGEDEKAEQAVALSFPDDVEIARKDGSRLEVRLTGRNATHVQFERLSDNMAFTFEIAALDTPTQKLILEYPEKGFVEVEEPKENEEPTVESLYVQNLREEIERIDRKMLDLQVEYAASSNEGDRRAFQREAQELNVERLRLSAEIAKRTGLELERRKPVELRKKY